jgi:PAS domain S-box-containing protein
VKRFRFSTKFYVSLGLIAMVLSATLVALFLGLIPDAEGVKRQGRAALSEAIAANGSAFLTQGDLHRLEATLTLVLARNPDILSAGVRSASGELLSQVGKHAEFWIPVQDDAPADGQVVVPILAGETLWGQIEMRFQPLGTGGWRGMLNDPRLKLIGFICLVAWPLFYFYLGRALKQLDPSQAVPTRVRTALDTMVEGLLVLDLDGHIVLANQAFAGFVHENPEALMGREVSAFSWSDFDGRALAPEEYPWAIALETGELTRNALACLEDPESGEQRFFLVNSSPIVIAEGKHGGVLISLEDITLLQQKERELLLARDEAQSANRAKSDFLANMSHEIRTPMNAILGFTDLLKRGYHRSDAEVNKYLNTIHSSGRHLLDLINDILDLSKVEAGRMEVERIDMAPHKIAAEVVRILHVKAEEKGIYLDFKAVGPIPARISSDPARVRQIITNLIGNALKFTEKGGVTLTLRLDGPDRYAMDIADTGIGIPADKLDAIFDPFVQAESSTTRRFGGTGLGLAISRRFARALGGDITIASKYGEGSVFTVILDSGPLDGVEMLDPEVVRAQAEEMGKVEANVRWRFQPKTVLVVDDGPENRELVRLVLDEAGLKVIEAENGQIALDKVAANPVDVILMDMQMPVMDGYTATSTLRAQGCQLPIVALTANAMKGFEQEVLGVGCSAYLTKPVDIDRLLEMLAGMLGAERVSVAPNAPLAAPAGETRAAPAAEGPAIVSRLANHPKLGGVARKFAAQLGERMRAFEQARAQGAYAELVGLGHWLKGAAGTVGFDTFTEPARNLEQAAKDGDAARVDKFLGELLDMARRVEGYDAGGAEGGAAPTDAAGVAAAPAAAKVEDDAPDRSPVVSRLANHPRLRGVVRKFALQLGDRMHAFEAARAQAAFEELAGLAHWLKGAAGTVGFDTFTEPARNLEQAAKDRDAARVNKTLTVLLDMASRVQIPDADAG